MLHYISSASNEQIKHVVKLHDKAYRYEHRQFIAQGTRTVQQLLSRYEPVVIYMTEKYYLQERPTHYMDYIVGVADHLMEKMSSAKNPSGICAVFRMPPFKDLPKSGPGIVLVGVADPGNVGTLIRTAAAMNIAHLIMVDSADPYSPKVIQSTAGCFAGVTIYQTSWQKIIDQQLNLCGLVVTGGLSPDQVDLTNRFLVVGSEAHGLTSLQINDCQQLMTLAMPGNAESLNAGIAGAIGLYLMMMQQ